MFGSLKKVNVRGFEQGYCWVWLRLRLEGVRKVKVGRLTAPKQGLFSKTLHVTVL